MIRKISYVRQKVASAPGPEDDAAPTEVVLERVLTRCDLERKLGQLGRETFFETLRVPLDADERAIEVAYQKQLFTWHPDRLPPSLRAEEGLARAICARLTEARRVLGDPARRSAYRGAVDVARAPTEADQRREREARADDLITRADKAMRARDFAKAEELAKQAGEVDAERSLPLALQAWAQAEKMGPLRALKPGATTPRYDAQLRLLDDAIRIDPRCERSRFFRAELLRRSGYVDEAIDDYRMTVAVNPRNVGAATAIHAYEMAKLRESGKSVFGRMLSGKQRQRRRTIGWD